MKLRLGAAVILAAALTPLSVVTTTPSPAAAGVDTSPPAIGSCFNLTYDEIRGVSSDKPPVDCSTRHTTLTFDVVEFDVAPDWNDEDSYLGEVYGQCNPSWIKVLGGDPRKIARSAYTYHWLLPTPVQREAGASWVRCELTIAGGSRTVPLPESVRLRRLPLPASIARCSEGARGDFRATACSRPHQWRATHSPAVRSKRWRGADKIQQLALAACRREIPRGSFRYSWPSSQYWWRLGFRYAVCYKRDADLKAARAEEQVARPTPRNSVTWDTLAGHQRRR